MPPPIETRNSKLENPSPPPPVAALLLAAGGSTRMGSPKQLLAYQGQTLLRRAAQAALAANLSPVIVVLGDDPTGQMHAQLADLPVQIALNPAWRAGLGTSIRTVMTALTRPLAASPRRPFAVASTPPLAGVLLMLCDQPLITASHLTRLLQTFHATGRQLVAAAYNNTIGVPAIFGPDFFPALLALPDDSGAKPILQRHRSLLQSVPMPEAATDLDTPASYTHLTQPPND